jgi:hypothetical protein
MIKVVADIEMPDDGTPPSITYPRDAFPSRPVFAVVIPPAGSEEEARLFALCSKGRTSSPGPVFHEGPRSAGATVRGYAIDTVDPEAVARLFERGNHPGDLRLLDAPRDRFGRDQTAVLTFLDLSQGLAHGDKISAPWEMRLGLAVACAGLGHRRWSAAADVLDPAGLMRDGAIAIPGGNPITHEGFHRYMVDAVGRSSRRMDVSHHPMRDFRLLQADEILEEIVRDGRAILYGCPDLPPEGPATDLLKRRLGEFVETIRTGGNPDAAYALLQIRIAATMAPGQISPALRRLMEGHGPGAVCWRNLFSPNGLIATALKRTRSPETTRRHADAASKLPHWARRAVLDPSTILTGCPRTLDQMREALGDRHRPYLSLPASRLAAAPGLHASLSALPKGHAEALLGNTALLLSALDEIENRHTSLPEARDAVAIGWHAVARTVAKNDPSRSEALAAESPGFTTERATALPFLSAHPAFHPSLDAGAGPRL